MKFYRYIFIIFIIAILGVRAPAQISPGELSSVHSHLEGVSNCTQCHILGKKVSNDKCLTCHDELKERTIQNKGYHSSPEIKGKECATCHNEHHGLSFQIIKLDGKKFDHKLTGFTLEGAHARKKCSDCHAPKNISNAKIKTKKFTFLGLQTACLSCHEDYHQKTLSENCNNCHDAASFKPTSKFDHAQAKYVLTGKHKEVECIKCHKTENKNGKKFQVFTGLQFNSCTDCHNDVHKNKFGQNCAQCHSEESFHIIKGIRNFDHNKTVYKLEGKHQGVSCKLCHKAKYTASIKHEKCSDCHLDFHKGEFAKKDIKSDCDLCHNINGFEKTLYTIEQHNTTVFPLLGAHPASPCVDCHKKAVKWTFRNIGKKCADCHTNIHKDEINRKYYPEDNCKSCHDENKWSAVKFEHSATNFKLEGAHTTQPCRKCHFRKNADGSEQQKFSNLSVSCSACHKDKHFKQFDKEGETACTICHETANWNPTKFNHANTTFKLEGKHENVPCKDCHKPTEVDKIKYIHFKIDEKCESCHS